MLHVGGGRRSQFNRSPVSNLSAQVAALMASFAGPAKLWFDPWDITTLQQDSAGTTPVTAAGDPIGRIMDKSGAANHATQATTTSRPLWQTTYAGFDGTDDSWATASIDFTSTDKVTVVAGVRKLSDAAVGIITELSAISDTTAGSFHLSVRGPVLIGYGIKPRGASGVGGYDLTPFPAPRTDVLDMQMDLAAATGAAAVIPRINGALYTGGGATGTPPGGGNFGNYPLFIGRRNNTSLPFNGNLYGLIIIGRLLTAPELTLCEQYMAQQAGISF